MGIAVGGALYGFISRQAVFTNLTNKLPVLGNKEITAGLALYYANRYTLKNKWVENAAIAALAIGAYQVGANFKLEGDHTIDGDEYAEEMGYISGDDIDDVDDEEDDVEE